MPVFIRVGSPPICAPGPEERGTMPSARAYGPTLSGFTGCVRPGLGGVRAYRMMVTAKICSELPPGPGTAALTSGSLILSSFFVASSRTDT